MRKQLLDHVGTAALALILAVIVWVNATYQADRPREGFFPEPIPIEVINPPADMIAANTPPDSVRVRIKAFSSSWPAETGATEGALTVSQFHAVADWSGLKEGMNEVYVQVTCSDRTVSIISVHPNPIYVRLERKKAALKDVEVELLNRDDVPAYYRVYVSGVEPSFVEVDGPASLVDRVDKLIARVSLLNQRATIASPYRLVPVDEAGREVKGVTLAQQEATVTVVIERKQNYREVTVRARTSGQPARGYFVSGIDIYPATVTVFGPPNIIDTMAGLVDVKGEIDLSGATQKLSKVMELNLPDGVYVLGAEEGKPFTVLVTVSIDAVTGGTTVEVPLGVRRVPEGLIATVSVPAVDVILTGPAVVLDELQIELLDAYVDLSGLGPGIHQREPRVEILGPQDSALRDLVIKDISPKLVEVTLIEPATPTPMPTPTIVVTATLTPTASITSTVTITSPVAATVQVTTTRQAEAPADAGSDAATRNR